MWELSTSKGNQTDCGTCGFFLGRLFFFFNFSGYSNGPKCAPPELPHFIEFFCDHRRVISYEIVKYVYYEVNCEAEP